MSVTAAELQRDEIDLRLVFAKLWRHKSMILASTLIFALAAAAYAFLSTPQYRATTVLAPAVSDGPSMGSLGQFSDLALLAGVNLGGDSSKTEEALAVLRSREFTEKFITDNNLMPVLFSSQWDNSAKQWRSAPDDRPTLSDGYRKFDKQIRNINNDKKTGLVELSVEWRDPNVAAQWANALVQRLNQEMQRRAIGSTNASVAYLEHELTQTTAVETRQAIARLMEVQLNQRMYASVSKEYAFKIVGRALPPDVDDPDSPNKPLLLVLGPILGLIAGAAFALLRSAFIGESKST